MSIREFKLAGLGFSILCIFMIEFVVQKAWINYLIIDSKEAIVKCYEPPKNNVDACLVEYVDNRNSLAKKGVNSYLITISLFAFIGICNLLFHINKNKIKALFFILKKLKKKLLKRVFNVFC